MRADHKGYSLIEIIIVIALIGILSGITVISINTLTSGNLKSAATKINTTLESVRTQDMSYTKKPSLYFYQDSDGKYRMFVSNDTSVSLTSQQAKDAASFGNLTITLTFKDSTGAEQEISNLKGRLYQVNFNSNSGALKETTLSTGNGYLTNIKIQKGTSGLEKNISIVPSTGKHSVAD